MTAPANILVVDDEAGNRQVLEDQLAALGYTTRSAENGRRAVEAINEQLPDLVLLDIMMPEMDGNEVLEFLKADPKLRRLPVIVISALDDMDSVVRCIEAGADDYLVKPFNPTLLEARIGACLEKTRMYREDIAAILDSLAEGIVILDEIHRIRDINRAACNILETDRQSVLQRDFSELFGERFCAKAAQVRESIERGRPIDNVISRMKTAGGEEKMLDFRTNVLPGDGRTPPGSVIVFRDLTELFHLKADIARRYQLQELVGKSKPMQRVFQLIEEVADSNATVLIEGESGTGKELVARAIHFLSSRADGPFVAFNGSALAESVVESELFGHVEGAFTGATRDKRGRFEAASGGTIFLDEIGDLAASLQIKLLRVLQQRTIERVGSNETIQVDIRVIAATHCPLAELVAEGTFRQDLYYRLRVVPVELPPLRNRREDVPLLAQHFVERFVKEMGRPIEGIGEQAMPILLDYHWPGNVRELENAIQYAFVKVRSGRIMPAHLPPEIRSAVLEPSASRPSSEPSPDGNERETLEAALKAAEWNVARAARHLNLSRTTIYEQIKHFGLTRPKKSGN